MSTAESDPSDELFSSVLAACDEALTAGSSPSKDSEADLPLELRQELERDLACAQLLHQVFQCPPPATSADSPGTLPWTRLGRFAIRREVGRGTFGIVYLAYDPQLGREVALKVPRAEVAADPRLEARFQREARAAAGLEHPNIVPIYEVGEVGPVCFLVTAYCPGLTLAQWLKQRDRPVPASEAAALVATLADAMHHAHTRGVIHRDLKPANILLQSLATKNTKSHEKKSENDAPPSSSPFGVFSCFSWPFLPKITDFGLAKLLLEQQEAAQTRSEAIVGTVSYMAPEQAGGRSKTVGPAADVYALGAILYELLTGRPPFQAESSLDTLLLVRTEEPVAPARLRPKLPRDLETICLKCLQKEPHQRYPSAQALAEDLRRFLAGEPIRARPLSWWARGAKWAKRRPAVAALLVSVVLATAVGIAGITWQWQRAEATGRTLARNLYYQNIALAEREWSANNFTRADQLLDECPPELRGWEWHYVRGFRRGSRPPLQGHTSPIRKVVFSPDGRRLASASHDGTVKVWDAAGSELFTLEGSDQLYNSVDVAFSADGRLLATIVEKGKAVKLWGAQTGQERLTKRDRTIYSVTFSPDSRRLIAGVGAKDAEIKFWDIGTGEEVLTLPGHAQAISSIAFHPDGRHLAASGGPSVSVWDVSTRREILTLQHTFKVGSVAFSPDGRRLASAGGPWFRGDNGEVKIWDAASGQLLRTLRGHTGHIFQVAFSPDGRRLATAGYDQTIKLWDVATGQEALSLRGHSDCVNGVAFSPDGRWLASASDDQTVRLWDATPLEERLDPAVATLRSRRGFTTCVAFSPDGQRLATAGQDQLIRLWDTATFQEVRTWQGHTNHINGLAFSPDGRRLVSGSLDRTAKVWDIATGQELLTFCGHTGVVHGLAFAPDGERIASADWQGWLKIWNAATGAEILSRCVLPHVANSLAFSGDGRFLASGSLHDGSMRIWNAQTGDELRSLTGHSPGRVQRVAFSPNSRQLASAGTDGTVKVWSVGTWEVQHTLTGHTGWVWTVAFSPDGRYLASAGNDATVRLWDRTTGQLRHSFHGHTRWVECVAFSPDSRLLASASWDGTVKVWAIPPDPE